MSPFSSKKQMRYMFAKHPEIARRWVKKTPDIKSLPIRKGSVSKFLGEKLKSGGR